jgi:aminoglycoside phosphotransferase (APT) family kinase protein
MRVIDSLIGLADRTPSGVRRAADVIPPALRSRRRDIRTALRRSMAVASQGPRTYLHGDLHVANTYLTADGAVGVCDWQVGLQGSWAHDYAYILATALEVEDRRAWERELLSFYLERLSAAGGGAIPMGQAWLAYRRATLYPYFAWLYTIGRWRLQPRFQPDAVSLVLIRRIAAAVEDLDSLAALGL